MLACASKASCVPAQVVNAYVTKDQDNNIILVAVDHIKAGEEVIPISSHVPSICVQQWRAGPWPLLVF
jgi:hypothetical protein